MIVDQAPRGLPVAVMAMHRLGRIVPRAEAIAGDVEHDIVEDGQAGTDTPEVDLGESRPPRIVVIKRKEPDCDVGRRRVDVVPSDAAIPVIVDVDSVEQPAVRVARVIEDPVLGVSRDLPVVDRDVMRGAVVRVGRIPFLGPDLDPAPAVRDREVVDLAVLGLGRGDAVLLKARRIRTHEVIVGRDSVDLDPIDVADVDACDRVADVDLVDIDVLGREGVGRALDIDGVARPVGDIGIVDCDVVAVIS